MSVLLRQNIKTDKEKNLSYHKAEQVINSSINPVDNLLVEGTILEEGVGAEGLNGSNPYKFKDCDCALEISEIWGMVKNEIKSLVGEATYSSWFTKIRSVSLNGGILELKVVNSFVKDWVLRNYQESLNEIVRRVSKKIFYCSIVVDKDLGSSEQRDSPNSYNIVQDSSEEPARNLKNSSESQLAEPGAENYTEHSLDDRFTFDTFIVGKPNEFAYAAAKRVCDSVLKSSIKERLPFNPLFLYGGVGLGKTHLMHAIACDIKKKNPHKRVVYLSAEKFMYHFIKAMRFRDMVAFKDQLRSVDVLMVDDFQFIIGKESTQGEFFHTFNELINSNKQVIMSADKSPADLDGLEERVRSRLGWGLVADLHPATYELRLGILQSKVEKLNLNCKNSVLEFIANKIETNIRELEGALTKLAVHACLVKQEIDIDMACKVLQNLMQQRRKVMLELASVQELVCDFYGIKLTDLKSAKRTRSLARPRQIAMYFAKKFTTMSLPEIGKGFGRDHTTVLHAVRSIEKLANENFTLKEDLGLIERKLFSDSN